ncbi:hypothetical protein CWI75_11635 [Kineobactrum sediminis]|uniref:DUF2783 domain-containing protein n=1 Tax=Kineobactrum sediminis TaxID=1905677 RepID=A0A2N5Y1Y2_9GAMM|nr:DUF2783 domain-containing protein [Kineobactrum sediminis]PLW82407.1 hypothetical protein CWI75_11635 [Kineobactrum sediminis]
MNETLEFADLEQVYDLLAEAIDQVGPERETLLLAKLSLLLAHHIPDISLVSEAIATALANCDTAESIGRPGPDL